MMTRSSLAGSPHSDISGSQDICSSPKLFAAYHVFHRLLVPRHPPYALFCLISSFRLIFFLLTLFSYLGFSIRPGSFRYSVIYSVTLLLLISRMSTTSNFFLSLLIIFSIFIFRRYFFLYEVFKVRYFICLMLSHCIIFFKNRQPPILPCRYRHSTFGRIRLYRRVRDVYGCSPYTHRHRLLPLSHPSFP